MKALIIVFPQALLVLGFLDTKISIELLSYNEGYRNFHGTCLGGTTQ